MLRVRCQAQVSVDAKGRMALPKPIRSALKNADKTSLVLAFHKGSVWGWTLEEFEQRVEGPLAERDPFDDAVMDFTHALLSTAQDVELDGQGRIRLPPELRRLAGISKDVVVHSVVNRIEIWDRPTWECRFEESLHATRGRSGMPRGEG